MSTLAKLTDLLDRHEQLHQDFDKRYTHTWLLLNGRPVQYAGRNDEYYLFKDIMGADIIWKPREKPEIDLELFLPDVGYYNSPTGPQYLYKAPQKQWKRSFCASIYQAKGVGSDNPYIRRTEMDTILRRLIPSIMTPEYIKLDQLSSNVFGNVALSKEIALLTNVENVTTLCYRTYPIADVDFKKKQIEMTQPTLFQEVLDYFTQTGVISWKLK